jgi:hypothetical protein
MTDPRKRILAVLSDADPTLAAALWNVRDVRDLPRETREAMCDALGHEAARRGLDANDSPNGYGRELDALIEALGLDETP